jgi:hypothetical protein
MFWCCARTLNCILGSKPRTAQGGFVLPTVFANGQCICCFPRRRPLYARRLPRMHRDYKHNNSAIKLHISRPSINLPVINGMCMRKQRISACIRHVYPCMGPVSWLIQNLPANICINLIAH